VSCLAPRMISAPEELESERRSARGAGAFRLPARRIGIAQSAVLLAACLCLSLWDATVARSVLAGGLIAVIPQAWFARRVFRSRGAPSAETVARDGYAAEVGKFALAAAGFGLVFALVRPLAAWAVFAGYGAMLIVQVAGAWKLLRAAVGQVREDPYPTEPARAERTCKRA